MDKTISIAVALIAIQLLLSAGEVSLGSVLDTWLTPVLVAIVGIDLLVKAFKK